MHAQDVFERPSFASLYNELTALATPDDIFGKLKELSYMSLAGKKKFNAIVTYRYCDRIE